MHYVAPVRAVVAVDPKTLKLMALLAQWLGAQSKASPA